MAGRVVRRAGCQPHEGFLSGRQEAPAEPLFVVQQQEALSVRFENPESLVPAREASRLAPNNKLIRHSQATLLLDEAKLIDDSAHRAKALAAVEREFRALVEAGAVQQRAPYVSLADIALFSRARTTIRRTKLHTSRRPNGSANNHGASAGAVPGRNCWIWPAGLKKPPAESRPLRMPTPARPTCPSVPQYGRTTLGS